jgi:transcriptional regulator with XRE-family HTH domain
MDNKLHMFIKELRNKREISQSDMAHQLEMARPTYIQMEKGVREPTASDIQKMAGIFGVPVTAFFDSESNTRSINVDLPKQSKKSESNVKSQDIRISVPQKNLDKFREVLLYILEKVGAKPNVGETVLYKLLYFIDFDFYEKYEEQLIGATYIKNRHGPTPVEFQKIVEDMKKKGEIEVVRSKYFQYEQKKYLPRRVPNLRIFTAQEKQHIDDVLARLSDKSAKELSDYSHGDIAWKIHEMGETLNYESVFYRDYKYSVKNYTDDL